MRRFKWLALALTLAVLIPSTVEAQRLEKPFLVEITGAWVPTSGEWGRQVQTGWAVGGMLAYAINPAIYLAGNFNTLWWNAESCLLCTDYTNYSYFGMIGFNPAAQNAQYDGLLLIGAGATTFRPEGGESTTRFSMNGGFRGYFWVAPAVGIAIDFMASVAFVDDTVFATSTIWSFPIGVGLAFRF
ncbi:MAG: hypothetical protein V3T74_09230 [Gemmatimonadales bacterium]